MSHFKVRYYKNLQILKIILVLRLNISVKFEHNSLISLKII